jgi:hypothetical protein
MTEPTRATTGGFEPRFVVERTDGQPIDPSRRYFVLDYSGADEGALIALAAYAQWINHVNPQLAEDIWAALRSPKDWPAQHRYAGP